ncbi:MAG: ABC transporter ATP-binding protein [Alphaproteobacteria bacterium]
MTEYAITLRNVTRRYGRLTALQKVSLSVAPGERLALLGHNGAGKTTLLKLVLGLIAPDEGTLTVLDSGPTSSAVRPHLAHLPENVAFHQSLTAREQMDVFVRLKRGALSEIPAILDRVGLSEAAGRRIGTFSKGMRQRLGLAQILIGQPRIVVLDEPTSGLDPVSRELFYEIIAELAGSGAAVIQSSHALTEMEARTDRIVILRKGETVADGQLSDLRARSRLPIRVHVRAAPDAADEIAARFGGRRMNGTAVELTCGAEDKVRRLAEVTALGAMVADIDVVPPSLEDLYRHYSRSADREEGAS